ncbi:hypothetical protein Tco_1523996 [Tanacetum coccineum]
MIYDIYDIYSSDEDDTASLDHLSNGLDKDKHVGVDDELNPEDEDRLGEVWPIHDPKTKWKFTRPVLGERCLTYYALSNGYKLYHEVNDGKRLLIRCSRNADGKPECGHHGFKKER